MVLSFILTLFTAPLEIIYWIKWVVAYVAIRFNNAFHKRRFDLYDIYAVGDPVKLGYVVPQIEKDLESPFPESHLQEVSIFYPLRCLNRLLIEVLNYTGVQNLSNRWVYCHNFTKNHLRDMKFRNEGEYYVRKG
ncbi:uncharacterized protein TNCV_4815561 [Trichonephila clavipes]|nr:uncharacterized protein TNCV_4815561 [Trichonephila clavipes]